MAVYLVDSSGIVKRYAKEIGSAWMMSITESAAAMVEGLIVEDPNAHP